MNFHELCELVGEEVCIGETALIEEVGGVRGEDALGVGGSRPGRAVLEAGCARGAVMLAGSADTRMLGGRDEHWAVVEVVGEMGRREGREETLFSRGRLASGGTPVSEGRERITTQAVNRNWCQHSTHSTHSIRGKLLKSFWCICEWHGWVSGEW